MSIRRAAPAGWLAAARVLRARGLDPATCTWVLNDIDPIALASTAVNTVVHGLGPSVVLRCGEGTSAWNGDDDPRMELT